MQITLLGGAEEAFFQDTGHQLLVTRVEPPAAAGPPGQTGERWEINAAYAEIRRTLAGSTLYKTSLKGERIVLSFISPQVGERYRAEMADLTDRLGWPLEINSNPNQGDILSTARALVSAAGGAIVKGPGILVERGEVQATLAAPLAADVLAGLQADFLTRTGYRLVINAR